MAYTLVPTELIVDGAITSAKLDTNIAISGTLGVTGEVTLATHLIMGDNDKIKIGTGGDLEIYHDGSNSYISNSTGNIYLGDTNGSVHIQAKLNEESIVCAADGAVTLYHNNAPKLATSSSGIDVTGTVTADGLTIDGNVEIGSIETATNFPLIVKSGTNDHAIAIEEASGGETWQLGVDVDGDLGFYNSGSTTASVTFDDSGNLLVSHTGSVYNNVNTTSTVGSSYTVNGEIFACSDQSSGVMILNRKSSDGNIASFRKDGTTVGSIGSTSGVVSHIVLDPRTGVKGAGLLGSSADANTGILQPVNHSGALADGAIQLGTSSNRFKDLHLSGTANVGSVSSGSASSASEIIATSLDNGTSFGSNRMLKLIGTSTTDNSRMGIHFTGNTGIGNGLGIIEAVNEDQSAGHTSLRMHTYSGSWNENNLVLKSGSVGIGTDNPQAKLELNVPTGEGLLIGSADIATIKMKNVGGAVKNWGFATTNLAASDFGIYQSNSNGGDPITAGSPKIYFNGSANIGIGTSSPQELIHAYSTSSTAIRASGGANNNKKVEIGYDNTNGPYLKGGSSGIIGIQFYVDNTTLAGKFDTNADFYTNDGTVHSLSDSRVKTDINDLVDGLDVVKQLQPKTFKYNEKSEFYNEETKDEVRYGFIADEVQEVAPQYMQVGKGKIDGVEVDDLKSLSTTKMIPMLVKAIQEQQTIIDYLKSRIETLENE